MRIAVVAAASHGPTVVGGVSSYLRRLTSGLKALGHEVVFEIAGETPGPQLARTHPSASAALGAALERSPDVLQATFALGATTIARHWPALSRVEHRVGAHFTYPPTAGPGPLGVTPAVVNRMGYWLTHTASLVPSPRMRDAVGAWGRPVVVPPPALDDHFDVRRPPSKGSVRFGYAGRLELDKGVGDLVAAFDGLHGDHGDRVHCEVFGYGGAARSAPVERRDHIAFDRLETSSRWSPERTRAMTDFLSRIDVLVLPYRTLDGPLDLPQLVVEGMAAGCTVISTTVGDVPWVLGRTVPTVPPGDPDALGDVLDQLARDPTRVRVQGRKLRQRAKEWRLTPAGAAQAYLKGLDVPVEAVQA